MAVLCLIYVRSVRKAGQSAPYGLCSAASWEHKRLFCSLSDCCTKKKKKRTWSGNPGVILRHGAMGAEQEEPQGSTRHSKDKGKRREEKKRGNRKITRKIAVE